MKEVFRLHIVESFREVDESQESVFVEVLSYFAGVVQSVDVVDAGSFWSKSVLFIGCEVIGFKVRGESEV